MIVFRDVAPSTDAVIAGGADWSELAWVLRDAYLYGSHNDGSR